jgi:hypothetical protein
LGQPIPGDCNEDGTVVVSELIMGVQIALSRRSVEDCVAMDRSGDGNVTVDELLVAVQSTLGEATPTPTRSTTATPTSTPTSSASATSTPSGTATPTPTPTPTPTVTASPTVTPTSTPPVVNLSGLCTRGLTPCAAGTTMRVFRCRSPEGRPCVSADADLVAETITDPNGVYEVSIDGKEVGGRALLVEADVARQSTWHMMLFGTVGGGGGAGAASGSFVLDIGPDTEAAFQLLVESGIGGFMPGAAEDVFATVQQNTAQLPSTLAELGIETPVEVAAAFTGQAEADVAVRELLGMPTDTFLSVRFTSKDGCVETGQDERIIQGGFDQFVFEFTDSKEGRLDDVELTQVDEFFVIGQRRNDGSFRLFARSPAYRRDVTGPFRGELVVPSFNGTETLNLEIQLHIKRTDVSGVPLPNGLDCVEGGSQRTCATCTVPLTLVP